MIFTQHSFLFFKKSSLDSRKLLPTEMKLYFLKKKKDCDWILWMMATAILCHYDLNFCEQLLFMEIYTARQLVDAIIYSSKYRRITEKTSESFMNFHLKKNQLHVRWIFIRKNSQWVTVYVCIRWIYSTVAISFHTHIYYPRSKRATKFHSLLLIVQSIKTYFSSS